MLNIKNSSINQKVLNKFIYVFLALVFIVGCKSKRDIIDTKNAESLSVRKIIKKHDAAKFDANTLDARLSVNYSENRGGRRNRYSFSVRLRMEKDSVIWLKGTYKILSAFRVKITPSSVSYYSPLEKHYFEGDFSLLKEVLGVDITFTQLQNLFLGESLLNLKDQKYVGSIDENAHKLTPKNQSDLYNIFFFIQAPYFKLKKQVLKVKDDSVTLRADYNGYMRIGNQLIPKNIVLQVSEGEKLTFINMDFKSVTINEPIATPYRIPNGYKPLKIK